MKELEKLSEIPLKMADTLAIERTRMAAERTMMGWVRTALSMISFGFTIFKFLETVAQREGAPNVMRPDSPRTVGLTLIGIGIFSLVIACLQHKRYTAKLGSCVAPFKLVDLSFVVAALIGLLGLLMFVSIIFSIGPLG